MDEAAVPRRRRLVGQPIPRFEDLRFITGRGRYTDDIAVAGAAHAAFVRADQAHAIIEAIDVTAAAVAPGVIAVLTGADYLADGHAPIRHNPIPLDAIDPKTPGFRRNDDYDHWQAFGAIQYHLFKKVFIKAVGGYALANFNPNTIQGNSYVHYNDMVSGRVRVLYLF